MPWRLIAAVAAATVAAYALGAPALPDHAWLPALVFAALAASAERFDINLYSDGRVSISALFIIAAAVALGPGAVLVVCPAVALAGHLGRHRPAYKLAFNLGVFVICGLAGAYAYLAVIAVTGGGRPFALIATVAAAVTNFALSSALIAAAIGAAGGRPVHRVWSEKFAWLLPHFAVLGLLAFAIVTALREFDLYVVAGFVAPILMTRYTMKQYVDRTERVVTELREGNARIQTLSDELAEAYHATLSAFVSALDTRDVETHGHSERVAALALELGEQLGIEPGSRGWSDLRDGALLHDVGKIGVPDAVLRKAGPLDPAEWELVREHPRHGHRMLADVSFLAGAAQLVLCHHERFDGGGYPRGLAGDAIPLGARIFAVADTFDAITSRRPYKAARPVAVALAEIARNAGTQFDPRVVQALLMLKGADARAA